MKKILIIGASGFIGKQLVDHLLQKGYIVRTLTRTRIVSKDIESFLWNPSKNFIDTKALQQVDVIVNLAGENIGKGFWTKKRKSEILESRVIPTNVLFDAVKKMNTKPACYISSSGIAIYGINSGQDLMTEDSPVGDGFLSKVTLEWERAAHRFESLGIRTVMLRTGIVLGKMGGALKQMEMPVRMGLGSALGSGKQGVSWIDISDLCRIIEFSFLNEKIVGVYNAVSPEPVSNSYFMETLAKTLGKPYFLPKVPSVFLYIIFGEKANIAVGGNYVSAKKIQNEGFDFTFVHLKDSLKAIYTAQLM